MAEHEQRKYSLLAVDVPITIDSPCPRLGDEFNVFTANSGREVQEIFTRRQVDLILSGSVNAKMDGIPFMEWVGQKHPWTIRLLTSQRKYPHLENKIRCWAFGFIRLPVPGADFLQILRQAVDVSARWPSWLMWNNGTVARLAQAIYSDNCFADLPILADALEEAGCENEPILQHCRQPGQHVRGCWVVDLLFSAFEIITCPTCSQKLRVPNQRGGLMVRCPNCRHAWDRPKT
jgi:hypothetical protein